LRRCVTQGDGAEEAAESVEVKLIAKIDKPEFE